MFLFLLVDFKFENGVWRIERGLKGMRLGNCEVELVICKRGQSLIIFIEIWLRKWKRKYNGILDPKVYLEKVWVKLFTFVWKIGFFLSISPRHSSKHTILNIHLNMHILAIYLKWSVCMCRCLCRCTLLESIVLYIIGLDTFYGLARNWNGIKVKYKNS